MGVKYPKEMDNPCDETLPSVFHIFPTITINFFQDFLRKKMIKKGHIFGMELILITKCIFVNHEVNLIWFQSLFFLAKNIFFSNKMVSTSLLAVLGLIYCWSGLVSHLFWKYSNTWEEEILCLCKNTFPQLCFAWNDILPARMLRCFKRVLETNNNDARESFFLQKKRYFARLFLPWLPLICICFGCVQKVKVVPLVVFREWKTFSVK